MTKSCQKCGAQREPRRCKNCKHLYDQARWARDSARISAQNKTWRSQNLERDHANKREYRLAHLPEEADRCRKWLGRNPGKPLEYREKYKERNSEKIKARYEATHEKRNAANREWKRAHPESARKHNRLRDLKKRCVLGSHTSKEWQAILRKHGGKCAHCASKERITKDHIIPLELGGSDYALNLQPLCLSCNSGKRDRLPEYTQFSLFDRKVA